MLTDLFLFIFVPHVNLNNVKQLIELRTLYKIMKYAYQTHSLSPSWCYEAVASCLLLKGNCSLYICIFHCSIS